MDLEWAIRAAVIYPDRDSGTSQGIDPAVVLARGCAIGDEPDIDASPLCPDECPDRVRTRCEAVGGHEDLRLGAVDRIKAKAVQSSSGSKHTTTAAPVPKEETGTANEVHQVRARWLRATRFTRYMGLR
jgi:hypothetical protein